MANNAGDVAIGLNAASGATTAVGGTTIGGVNYTFAGTTPAGAFSVGSAGRGTSDPECRGRTTERQLDRCGQRLAALRHQPAGDGEHPDGQHARPGLDGRARKGPNATNVGTASATGNSIDLKNGDGNIVVAKNTTSNDVSFDLADDIAVNSVTAGGTVLGTTGLTIAGGPSVTTAGISAGGLAVTNVAAGVNATDAVNVSQLTSATGGTTTAGMNFTGNDNSAGNVHRDLGQTLAIQGGATTAGTYSGGNIRTVTDPATGAVNIEMADAPTFGGVTVNAGGTGKITGVTAGTATTDAVNVGQLEAVGAVADNAVQYDDAGHTSVTLGGTGAAAPVGLHNVAAGTLSAASTDAVNGSQLFATNQTINTLGQGWTVSAQGANATNVGTASATGNSIDLKNGDGNIVVAKSTTSNDVSFDLADDIAVNSVTAGGTVLGTTGLTIAGGPSVTTAGISAGGLAVTNVAAGVNATDAVNVSQLTSATGGTTTAGMNFTGNDNSAGNVHRDLGQTLAIQGGATTAGTYSGGNIRTVTDPATGAVNIQMADAPTFGGVTVNAGGTGKITGVTAGTATTDAVNVGQLEAVGAVADNAVQYDDAGHTSVTLGGTGAAAPVGLHNVAAGTLSAASTDAVNGSQLFATNQTINTLGQGWTVSAQGANATNVGTASATGNSIDLKNGDGNIVVAKSTTSNDVSFDLADDIAVNSVTAGGTVLGTTGLTIAGGPSVTTAGISAGGLAVTNVAAGVNATDAVNVSQLTSATGGTTTAGMNFTGNDASAGNVHRDLGQTLAIQGGATTAGTYSGGNIRTVTDPATGAVNIEMADAPTFGGVTVNAGGTGKITGVTAGTVSAASTDAVNGSQLFATNQTVNTLGQGWTVSAQGANATNVGTASATGNSIDLKNGDGNIVVAKSTTSNDVSFDLADDIAVNSVTAGGTVLGTTGLTIAGGPSVTTAGISAGGLAVTNVAAGVNATDAVNVSQLTSATGGTTTAGMNFTGNDNSAGNVHRDLGQTLAIQGGATTAGTYSGGNIRTVTDPATGAVNIEMADAPTFGGVTVNAGGTGKITGVTAGTATTDAVNVGQLEAVGAVADNAVQYDDAGHTSVTLGGTGAAAPVGLHNVAAGTLSAASTDAVNGSQLFATNQTVNTLGQGWTVQRARGERDQCRHGQRDRQQHRPEEWRRQHRRGEEHHQQRRQLRSRQRHRGQQRDRRRHRARHHRAHHRGRPERHHRRDQRRRPCRHQCRGGRERDRRGQCQPAHQRDRRHHHRRHELHRQRRQCGQCAPRPRPDARDPGWRHHRRDLFGRQHQDHHRSGDRRRQDPDGRCPNLRRRDRQCRRHRQDHRRDRRHRHHRRGQCRPARGTSAAVADNAVQYDDAGHTSVTLGGTGAAAPVGLHNVAAGTVSAASTDAVNGSQLFATNQTVNTLGQGWTVSAQGANATNVGTASTTGNSIDLKNGDGNIVVAKSGTSNDVTFDLADDVAVNSVTAGGTVLGTSGLTIAGGPSVTTSGINAGGLAVTNVAAGVNATDAVNVSQLTSATGGTTTAGMNFTGNDASAGNVHRDLGQTLAIQGGATTAGTYSGGNIKTVTDPATGAVNIEMADAPTFGGVTVNAGGTGKITGVTAGTVSATSTDAVNGSQLFATNQTVNTLGQGWTVSAQGANATNVGTASATGNSIDLKNGDGNIVVAKNTTSNDVSFDLADDIAVNSVTAGGRCSAPPGSPSPAARASPPPGSAPAALPSPMSRRA